MAIVARIHVDDNNIAHNASANPDVLIGIEGGPLLIPRAARDDNAAGKRGESIDSLAGSVLHVPNNVKHCARLP